jgi:hypothetical protein
MCALLVAILHNRLIHLNKWLMREALFPELSVEPIQPPLQRDHSLISYKDIVLIKFNQMKVTI